MQDDDLFAKRPPDNEHRLDQHRQVGEVVKNGCRLALPLNTLLRSVEISASLSRRSLRSFSNLTSKSCWTDLEIRASNQCLATNIAIGSPTEKQMDRTASEVSRFMSKAPSLSNRSCGSDHQFET
jgi:hypothetical protein